MILIDDYFWLLLFIAVAAIERVSELASHVNESKRQSESRERVLAIAAAVSESNLVLPSFVNWKASFCINNDEVYIKHDEFCIKDDGFCVKHDGFFI